jgi:hypothetical protein
VGFELTIPVFERVKTFYALDGAAAVIGTSLNYTQQNHTDGHAVRSAIVAKLLCLTNNKSEAVISFLSSIKQVFFNYFN